MLNLKENIHAQVKAYCAKKGITLIQFCDCSGVELSYLQNWRKGNPMSIAMLAKIIDGMQDIENNISNAAV